MGMTKNQEGHISNGEVCIYGNHISSVSILFIKI